MELKIILRWQIHLLVSSKSMYMMFGIPKHLLKVSFASRFQGIAQRPQSTLQVEFFVLNVRLACRTLTTNVFHFAQKVSKACLWTQLSLEVSSKVHIARAAPLAAITALLEYADPVWKVLLLTRLQVERPRVLQNAYQINSLMEPLVLIAPQTALHVSIKLFVLNVTLLSP